MSIIMSSVSRHLPTNRVEMLLMKTIDKPDVYTDAPISLQLVGRRYEDEKVIEALEFMMEVAGMPV